MRLGQACGLEELERNQGMPRLNLGAIEDTLAQTKAQWRMIENALAVQGVDRKDVPFNDDVMQRMLAAYELLDHFLVQEVDIFHHDERHRLCALNEAVHYGNDWALRREYKGAIQDNREKFYHHIPVVCDWYDRKRRDRDTGKVAAKVYVSILAAPQVFNEGNHRSGALIASWINVTRGEPPFVLSPDNAVGFFLPSSQIKHFSARSYWRGRHKLPKYHQAFRRFWIAQTRDGMRYLR